jgi:predicted ester cyclase
MNSTSQRSKDVVLRFNKEFIEQGNIDAFKAIMADDFVNRSAPQGTPSNADGMFYFFEKIIRPALSDLNVTIHDQVAEGNTVTTRKTISGVHTGELMGIPPTNKQVQINVIDMVTLKEEKYFEHWGQNNFSDVLRQLAG